MVFCSDKLLYLRSGFYNMNQDCFDISCSGSRLLEDADIQGDIKSEKDICLEGLVVGSVECAGRVIVNKGGEIDGKVNCRELYLNGVIAGDACVEGKAVLGADAVVKGTLTTAYMEITLGAKIELGLKLKNASK